jgi:hypothetical protein
VLAPATIEECFHIMVTARRMAEAFRCVVMVLSDANLATGVQPFPRPELDPEWLAPPIDQSPWPKGLAPYAWDEATGISPRPIPGQAGGEYVLTGLATPKAARWPTIPSPTSAGSRCGAASWPRCRRPCSRLRSMVTPTAICLVVGWGSTLGAIEEAVDRLRAQGQRVSALHLRVLSPLPLGLAEIFARFKAGHDGGDQLLGSADEAPYCAGTRSTRVARSWRSTFGRETLHDVDYVGGCTPGQPLTPGHDRAGDPRQARLKMGVIGGGAARSRTHA